MAERSRKDKISFKKVDVAHSNLPQVVAKSEYKDTEANLPLVVAELNLEDLFAVPWGHHRLIIDRCKDDSARAAFFC